MAVTLNRERAKGWMRQATVILLDALLIVLGIVLAVLLRYGDNAKDGYVLRIIRFSPIIVLSDLVVMSLFGVYKVNWRYADMRDMLKVVFSLAAATGMNLFWNRVFHFMCARLVISLDGVISVMFLVAMRYAWILFQDLLLVEKTKKHVRRALIVGANTEGALLSRHLNTTVSDVRRVAVAFLDEDVEKLYRKVAGIPVEGMLADIGQVVRTRRIDEVIFVNRELPANLLRHVYYRAHKAGCNVLVAGADYSLREAKIEDILAGWKLEPLEEETVREFSGKRFLVVGAGSVGRELVKQLAQTEPEAITVIDSSEDALLNDLPENALGRVADVRDMDRIEKIMRAARPDYVFHTAALTRAETANGNSLALAGVNVLGAEYIWKMARDSGAKTFAFVSDIGAYEPSDAVEMSRAMGERCVLRRAKEDGEMKTVCVRLGSIVTSRGGILSRIHKQAQKKEAICVGSKEKRSFLSAPSAARCVLTVAAKMDAGVYVVDPEDEVDMPELIRAIVHEMHFDTPVTPVSGNVYKNSTEEQKENVTQLPHVFIARETAMEIGRLDSAITRAREAVAADDEEKAEQALLSGFGEKHPA